MDNDLGILNIQIQNLYVRMIHCESLNVLFSGPSEGMTGMVLGPTVYSELLCPLGVLRKVVTIQC